MMPEPITVATRKRVPTKSAVTLLCGEVLDIGVNGRTREGKTPRSSGRKDYVHGRFKRVFPQPRFSAVSLPGFLLLFSLEVGPNQTAKLGPDESTEITCWLVALGGGAEAKRKAARTTSRHGGLEGACFNAAAHNRTLIATGTQCEFNSAMTQMQAQQTIVGGYTSLRRLFALRVVNECSRDLISTTVHTVLQLSWD
jgi:hypothetical protein